MVARRVATRRERPLRIRAVARPASADRSSSSACDDDQPTRAALRFFKERRVLVHFVDLRRARSRPASCAGSSSGWAPAACSMPTAGRARDAGLGYLRLTTPSSSTALLADPRLLRLPLVRHGNERQRRTGRGDLEGAGSPAGLADRPLPARCAACRSDEALPRRTDRPRRAWPGDDPSAGRRAAGSIGPTGRRAAPARMRGSGRRPRTRSSSRRPSGRPSSTTDPWRALRILAEFVEGFDALADARPGRHGLRLGADRRRAARRTSWPGRSAGGSPRPASR